MELISTHIPEVSLIVRMLISVLLGGLIGLEREYQGQSAGLRTYIILSLGGCIFMSTSINSSYYGTHGDVERIAAQVISGVGFLGAAVIFNRKGDVRGLTNAVSIWATAIIGLTTGCGLIYVALISTFFIIFILSFFNYFEKMFFYYKYTKVISVKGDNRINFLNDLEKEMKKYNVILRDYTVVRDELNKNIEIKFFIKIPDEKNLNHMIEEMQNVSGVHSLAFASDNN